MIETKITIVTPTYNRAHTLPRVYDSLKNQTFKDFKWIIMDDGSTDNTNEVVFQFQSEGIIDIDYHWNENAKKFYTVFEGINKVTSDYFVILDSDDAYVEDGLQKMYNIINKLDDRFISATFNSQFPNGELVGTEFPENFEGSILEMRYKFQIKGDKHSIFKTKKYLNYLSKFDYYNYKHKYAPQKIFFNIYDANGELSKFVNEKIRIYYQDENDLASMSNDRVKPSSYLGLMEGYKSFLNSYGNKLFQFPNAFIRNLIGYHYYSILLDKSFKEINSSLNHFKFISFILYPFSYVYTKLKTC
ncbi:MAG: glycosyltransferase family 2 protein [Weeksellaceae bacterium]|nr:glycosyltransferase family 2 protein [Weeksellaceae bacterium]